MSVSANAQRKARPTAARWLQRVTVEQIYNRFIVAPPPMQAADVINVAGAAFNRGFTGVGIPVEHLNGIAGRQGG